MLRQREVSLFLVELAQVNVRDTAVAGVRDKTRVLGQGAASVSQRGRRPALAALGKNLLRDVEVNLVVVDINHNLVAILNKRNGSSLGSLRHNVANQETVRTTREAAVSQQSNVLTQTVAHQGRRGLQHLRHTRSTLGALVSDNGNSLLALLDLASLERVDKLDFVIVHTGATLEVGAFLTRDLGNGTAGRKSTSENLQVTSRLDGVAQGSDDLLALGHVGKVLHVLRKSFTRACDGRAIEHALLEEELGHSRSTANLGEIGHDVLAGRLHVSQKRSFVTDSLEVVDSQLNANRLGNGNHVQNSIGRTASNDNVGDGILKSSLGHNVAGLKADSEQILDGLTGFDALLVLGLGSGRVRRRAGEGHTEKLSGGGHRVGSVHTTASTLSRAGVLDNIVTLLHCNLLRKVLTVRLESGDDIKRLALELAAGTDTGIDSTTVNHDGGSVDTAHGHQDTRHVLVAARNGNVGVVVLGHHHGLNGVGNNVSGLKRVSHTLSTVGHTVRNTNGVELHALEAGLLDTVLDSEVQVEKMHVAGVAGPPDGRDTDLSLVKIVSLEAGTIKHGLRGTLVKGLGDGSRNLVELVLLAGGRGLERSEKVSRLDQEAQY